MKKMYQLFAVLLSVSLLPAQPVMAECSVVDVSGIVSDTDVDFSVSVNDADNFITDNENYYGFKLNFSEEKFNEAERELENSNIPVIDLDNQISCENDIDADMTFEYPTPDVEETYPSKYDPRSLGLVTPVKNQGKWGLCCNFYC